MLRFIYTDKKRIFFFNLCLNIKLDVLSTHLEAMSSSLSLQRKWTIIVVCDNFFRAST